MNSEYGDRVLLLGAGGQIGTELRKLFPQAVCTTHKSGDSEYLDLEDSKELEKVIFSTGPNLIINAAAMTGVDDCESRKKSAYLVNSLAIKHIVGCARKLDCKVIHFSTDYVFDGMKGQYSEEEIPNPVNFYGLSKLLGDVYAQSYDKTLIVRTSGVYGFKGNFPAYVYNHLSRRHPIQVIESYYSPIHSHNLALAVEHLIQKRTHGLVNVAGDRISRYKFAQSICSKFNLDVSLVQKIDKLETLRAKRPFDSSLNISKARSLLQFDFHSMDSNLRCFVDSMIRTDAYE